MQTKHQEMFRFVIAGGMSFLIEACLFCALKKKTNLLLANSMGVCFGSVSNYLFCRTYVFRKNSKRAEGKSFILFSVVSILSLLINNGIIWFCICIVELGPISAKIMAASICMIINYRFKKKSLNFE